MSEFSMADAGGWRRRRFLSASLRAAVTLVPILAAIVVSLVLNQLLPSASGTITAIGRFLFLGVCSLVTLAMTDAAARRFLPLAALLQLSLVFPDQTPSRFRTALKGGSGRRLAREVAKARSEGLSDDPTRAAEQLLMLATAIGDHDRRTRGHSERVRLYTELIAEELDLSDDERSRLQWAALIHDIGKVTVPAEILNKKGPPDEREWSILKTHPLAGEQLTGPVEPWLGDAVHAVGGHHERWDGSGYPRGVKADEIPRSAAIVAVADAFEVMTAVRSYKKAMPLSEARAELTRCAGTHFSPEVVRALLNVSIGKLRRSMGVFAAIAHLPFLGQVTKAAAYAPDTVSTAAGLTTATATAGFGVLALTGGLAIASPHAPADIPPVTTTAMDMNAVWAAAQARPLASTTLPADAPMSAPATTSPPTAAPTSVAISNTTEISSTTTTTSPAGRVEQTRTPRLAATTDTAARPAGPQPDLASSPAPEATAPLPTVQPPDQDDTGEDDDGDDDDGDDDDGDDDDEVANDGDDDDGDDHDGDDHDGDDDHGDDHDGDDGDHDHGDDDDDG